MRSLEHLKEEFNRSERYSGYTADEDPGYFVEWLVEQLQAAETRAEDLAAIVKVLHDNTERKK